MNDKKWKTPITMNKTTLALVLIVVFATGMYVQQLTLGAFYIPYIANNNQPRSNDDPAGNGSTTTVTDQGSFELVEIKSGYDSLDGSYSIRFAVTVQEVAGKSGTCHLYISVYDENNALYGGDQQVDLDPYGTVTRVYTWPVATYIWEQDLIDWSTASVIIVSDST